MGIKDPWHAGDDPWKSTTASFGDENKVTHYVPGSAALIFEQMACRIGKAFRLANADLFRQYAMNTMPRLLRLLSYFADLGRD